MESGLASLNKLESGELGQLENGHPVGGQDHLLDAAVQHLRSVSMSGRDEGFRRRDYGEAEG